MLAHHVTDLQCTCIRPCARAHTHTSGHGCDVCSPVHTPGATASHGRSPRCWTRVPILLQNCSVNLGRCDCWLRFRHLQMITPSSFLHRALISSKHFPSVIPLSLYTIPEGQLLWPAISHGEPEVQQSEATCPSLHSERGSQAWNPRFLTPSSRLFLLDVAASQMRLLTPAPPCPWRSSEGIDALSIMGCKTH